MFSQDTNNSQLQELKDKLNDYEDRELWTQITEEFPMQYKYWDSIDDDQFFESELGVLIEDIQAQSYKFHHANPGEMIKLTSMITARWGPTVFATREANGEFCIILQGVDDKKEKYFRIDKSPIEMWHPSKALNIHMNYLAQKFGENPPDYLKPYVDKNYAHYAKAIEDNLQRLSTLPLGEKINIVADESENRAHELCVLRDNVGELHVLLKTGNDDEPYIQIDKEKKVVWKEYIKENKMILLDQQAIAFLNRIDEAKKMVESNGLPSALKGLITKDDLIKMYMSILDDPSTLSKLVSGQEYRIDKSVEDNPRTMNIIRGSNGEFMLMVETKRKVASGHKDSARLIGKGTFGTVKPTWRIDSREPEEWVNKTMKGALTLEADYEAIFSHRLIENRGDETKAPDTLNTTLLGELFTSKNIVKRSQYSKRAVGDLLQVLDNPNIVLTPEDKDRITKNILDGVALCHSQRKILQDIKLPNIFIYKDNEGYYAKIGDFGIAFDPALTNMHALASALYESPEIFLAYSNKNYNKKLYDFYHDSATIKKSSYGYQKHTEKQYDPNSFHNLAEAQGYRVPHPANDMWALGIALYLLGNNHSAFPTDAGLQKASPLIQGLLKTKREERFTVQQALEQLEKEKAERRLAHPMTLSSIPKPRIPTKGPKPKLAVGNAKKVHKDPSQP